MRGVVVCIALAGCVDSGARSAVNGKFVDRLYTPAGVVDQPADMSTRGFRVFSNGRWYPENGLTSGALDGTIYIEAPDGPYLLNAVYADGSMTWDQRDDHTFVDVTARTGRPGAQLATNVPMQLQIGNLAPWSVSNSDELFVDCYENGTQHYPLELEISLQPGATELRGTFDWASASSLPSQSLTTYQNRYLIDADAGDTLTVSRTAAASDGTFTLVRLTQIARGSVGTQRDGEASSFSGSFTDVAQTATQQFVIDMPAITGQLPDVEGWVVGLRKSPSSVAFDTFGPSLLLVSPNAAGTAPVTVTTSYGDPFDASWQLVATGAYAGPSASVVLPDGRSIYPPWRTTYATEQRHLEPGADFTLGPTRAFITAATLDGHDLAGDIPWDGQSPLALHVDVPAGELGFVADVAWVPAGAVFAELWTTLRSQSADLVLPADALQVGLDYLVRIGVTNVTATSSTAAYRVLGPFRLVR